MGKDIFDAISGPQIKPGFSVNENYNIDDDAIFKRYANTTSPLSLGKKTRSGLSPYTGVWNKQLAIHLLNRAMFGAKPSDVNTILPLTASTAVDALLNTVPNPFPDGINWYENTYADITGVAFGASWVNADWGDGSQNYYRQLGTKAMWMKNIHTQNLSLQEKMVMFLYNLVPVQFNAVGDARFLHQYVKLLHQFALGNYKDYIREVTKNGAMLYFLNGYINNKYSPDENYGRELQELFSVGKEGGQQYAEDDVRMAAKVLTGWRVDEVNRTTFFDVNYHDTTNKTFSAFYNNTVITGQSGTNAGDLELDALLNMIFSGQSATTTAHYICTKLYRFFVYYDIDANIDATIITPLANTFIANNWNLKPVIEQLLKSDHFFDTLTQGCYIKTPLDTICGITRVLNVPLDPTTTFEDEHWLYVRQNYYSDSMAMGVGEVPNVSGYKPYYQSPQWHELFINSNTYPKRLQWTDQLLTAYGHYVNGNNSYKADLPAFASSLSNPSDPDILIEEITKYTFGLPISLTKRNHFKAILLNNQSSNSYWTLAWADYLANPTDPLALGTVTNRLRLVLTEMLRMAEHQLC
jgi:uncharacterized protein (DUF1800 family)